jgi:hypothetical protein
MGKDTQVTVKARGPLVFFNKGSGPIQRDRDNHKNRFENRKGRVALKHLSMMETVVN